MSLMLTNYGLCWIQEERRKPGLRFRNVVWELDNLRILGRGRDRWQVCGVHRTRLQL